MEVTSFQLRNVGCFRELELVLAPTDTLKSNVTVLVGGNGSGKTSILKALATSLSWYVARIRSEKGSGTLIPELVISNGTNSASIDIKVCDDVFVREARPMFDEDYTWSISRTRSGRKAEALTQLSGLMKLVSEYRKNLTEDELASLPLIAFYPVERVVLDIPLKIRVKHSFQQLDGYDNALNQGVDFRRFFEWFREREDTENESGISQDTIDQLLQLQGISATVWEQLKKLQASSRDRQLVAVRTAIANFMPGFSNLRVRRRPRLHMSVDKGGQVLDVLQLSQGEKSLIALVGDIARRLAMMNPSLDNPLEGDGIVLIDEIDMHLHPTWQRSVVTRLRETFPNCQFLLTTHSPLVISDTRDILVYVLDDGEIRPIGSLYGQDANTVLVDVMDTDVRNVDVQEKLMRIFDAIQDLKFDSARSLLRELEAELPKDNLELAKAKLLLRKQEIKAK